MTVKECNHKFFMGDYGCQSCRIKIREIGEKIAKEMTPEGIMRAEKAREETLQFVNSAVKGLN